MTYRCAFVHTHTSRTCIHVRKATVTVHERETREYERRLRKIVGKDYDVSDDDAWDFHLCETRERWGEFSENLEDDARAIREQIEGHTLSLKYRARPKVVKGDTTKRRKGEIRAGGEPPEWWREHWRRELDKLRKSHQRAAFVLFDLDAPLSLKAAEALIEALLKAQDRTGNVERTLYYSHVEPEGSSPYWHRKAVYHNARNQRALVGRWTGYSEPPLWKLVTLAGEIEQATGCEPGEATDFLLCDEPFLPPQIRRTLIGGGFLDMRISLCMSAEDVASAYRQSVEWIRENHGEEAASGPKRPRKMRARSAALLALVGERERGKGPSEEEWGRFLRLWNKEHSERTYPNIRAIREAWYRAKRAEVGGAER